MEFKVHDGSLINGVSSYDIRDFSDQTAKEIGLKFLDYDTDSIAAKLNKDQELIDMAQASYTPYPIMEGWREEYKALYREQIKNRTAPGYADIPDDIIHAKIREMLSEIAEQILPERIAKAEAAAKELDEIMQHVKSIETKSEKIEDEGGWTKIYYHLVTMADQTVLKFTDRNLFDVGRVINPAYSIKPGMEPGGLLLKSDDGTEMWWFNAEEGWFPVRPLTENEHYAMLAIQKYHGHHDAKIRM